MREFCYGMELDTEKSECIYQFETIDMYDCEFLGTEKTSVYVQNGEIYKVIEFHWAAGGFFSGKRVKEKAEYMWVVLTTSDFCSMLNRMPYEIQEKYKYLARYPEEDCECASNKFSCRWCGGPN